MRALLPRMAKDDIFNPLAEASDEELHLASEPDLEPDWDE